MMKSSTLDAQSRPASMTAAVLNPASSWSGIGPETAQLPLLVVFKSCLVDDADGDEADVERIRAEVRGLGVTLLVVAPDAMRFFESNDRYRCLRSPDLVPRQLLPLFRTFAVTPPDSLPAADLTAAFVIGPHFEIRFAFRQTPESSEPLSRPASRVRGVLLRALVAASTALEMIRLPHVSLVELTTRSLVLGFEQALAEASLEPPAISGPHGERPSEDGAPPLFGHLPNGWGSSAPGLRRKTDPAILRRRSPHVGGPRLDADG